MLIFDPHTQTNLLPLHGYSNGPQIGYRPSPSIKKGASSLQICNHITTKHMEPVFLVLRVRLLLVWELQVTK